MGLKNQEFGKLMCGFQLGMEEWEYWLKMLVHRRKSSAKGYTVLVLLTSRTVCDRTCGLCGNPHQRYS